MKPIRTTLRLIDAPNLKEFGLHVPRRSKQPWAGYSKGDWPRATPLAKCPAARCRRLKKCAAAHDDLYCQREFLAPPAYNKLIYGSDLARAIRAVPKADKTRDLLLREEYVYEIGQMKLRVRDQLTKLWKDGVLEEFYGPYKASGVFIAPPERRYVET